GISRRLVQTRASRNACPTKESHRQAVGLDFFSYARATVSATMARRLPSGTHPRGEAMTSRLAIILTWSIFLAAPFSHGGNPAKDKEALQGTWQMVEATLNGKKASVEVPDFLKGKLVVAGERMRLV